MRYPTPLLALACLSAASAAAPAQDFGAAQILDSDIQSFRQVITADMDGDGDADILASSNYNSKPRVIWYENVSGAFFKPGVPLFTTGIEVVMLAVADLDGDGDMDIATADQTYGWYENLGGLSFGPFHSFGFTSFTPTKLEIADLDGDGDPDILSAIDWSVGGPFWFENLGNGSFSNYVTLPLGIGWPKDFEVADLDGDGDLDVVVAEWEASQIVWRPNNGDGTFAPKITVVTTPFPNELELSDLDHDGDLDVLWTVTSPGNIEAVRNDGSGGFGPIEVLTTDAPLAADLSTGDIDGDGLPDLAWQTSVQNSTYWNRNLGNLQFGPKSLVATTAHIPGPLLLEDFDVDGDSDIVWGADESPSLLWARATSALGDCDGDGTPDAIEFANGTATDCNGNGIPDNCELASPYADVDGDGLLDACLSPSLSADFYYISLSQGGQQTLQFNAPPGPLSIYLVLGSSSGTSPGTLFGGIAVPLNVDAYTLSAALSPGTLPYKNFLGVLAAGATEPTAPPTIFVPASSDPSLVGLTLHHAFLILDIATGALNFSSNAVPLTLDL